MQNVKNNDLKVQCVEIVIFSGSSLKSCLAVPFQDEKLWWSWTMSINFSSFYYQKLQILLCKTIFFFFFFFFLFFPTSYFTWSGTKENVTCYCRHQGLAFKAEILFDQHWQLYSGWSSDCRFLLLFDAGSILLLLLFNAVCKQLKDALQPPSGGNIMKQLGNSKNDITFRKYS